MTAGELSSREIASQPLISVHREVRLGHSSAKPRVRSGTQLAGRMGGLAAVANSGFPL